MTRFRSAVGALAVAMVSIATTPVLAAQQELPLAPNPSRGLTVSPFFEGWFANPDGTYTLSFGYFNRNTAETLEIPLGADNFIQPAQFDGGQPTSFPPRRERGVFAVTIPAEMANQDVVWTLRNRGQTFSVPGRVTSAAYELGHQPMAAGSLPPLLRFAADGPVGQGVPGILVEEPRTVAVGMPLPVEVWLDDSVSKRDPVALALAWFKHSGPGEVTFQPATQARINDGRGATTVSFSAPGEYVIRGRVDNFASNDSSSGDQCCWTNGYLRVVVTP